MTKDIKYKETFEYRENGERFQHNINIRLNDECKNGHSDFAITSDIYHFAANGRKQDYMSGCCHDEILKRRPKYEIFVRLHLCDFNGAPMYAAANGFYHLKRMSPDEFINYFNIDANQYDAIEYAEDQEHFQYLIEKTDILKTWKALADEAICILEEKTGQKWDRTEERKQNYTPLELEKTKAIEQRIKEGFYTVENINKRSQDKLKNAINKKIEQSKKRISDQLKRAKKDHQMLCFILDYFQRPDIHFIWYDHTSEICFDWSYTPEDEKTEVPEIEKFADHLRALKNDCKMPSFITLPLVISHGDKRKVITTIY